MVHGIIESETKSCGGSAFVVNVVIVTVTIVSLEILLFAGRTFPLPGLPVHIPCGRMYPRHHRPGKASAIDS